MKNTLEKKSNYTGFVPIVFDFLNFIIEEPTRASLKKHFIIWKYPILLQWVCELTNMFWFETSVIHWWANQNSWARDTIDVLNFFRSKTCSKCSLLHTTTYICIGTYILPIPNLILGFSPRKSYNLLQYIVWQTECSSLNWPKYIVHIFNPHPPLTSYHLILSLSKHSLNKVAHDPFLE